VQNDAANCPLASSRSIPWTIPSASSPSPISTRFERERSRLLVERRVVNPRHAVDVVRRREAVILEVPQALELPDAVVDDPFDRHALELAAVERQVGGRALVVEERRHEEQPLVARRHAQRAETRPRVLATFLSVLDRCSVPDLALPVDELVEDVVADQVLVLEEDPRVIAAPCGG
jgi:hypothetical protein